MHYLSLHYSMRQRRSAACIAQLHRITNNLSLNYSLRQRRSLYYAVTSNQPLLVLHYSLRQRGRYNECLIVFVLKLQFAAATLSSLRSYSLFYLFITVCGNGAIYFAQLHRITHYLFLNYSLRQRRSLHCPVTSNYSLFVFKLQLRQRRNLHCTMHSHSFFCL